jgi:hypothetical protein
MISLATSFKGSSKRLGGILTVSSILDIKYKQIPQLFFFKLFPVNQIISKIWTFLQSYPNK